jgi:ribosomal protein S18 acetylase RimI-like enzyme
MVTASEVDEALVAGFARLLPQLSPGAAPLELGELRAIAAGPATTLFVARAGAGGAVLGAVTLVQFRIPSGRRARIESLVVDEEARGRGVGEALCRAALALARQQGADTVDLTSSPARAAAHALYQKLGFTQRDTAVYRYRTGRSSS